MYSSTLNASYHPVLPSSSSPVSRLVFNNPCHIYVLISAFIINEYTKKEPYRQVLALFVSRSDRLSLELILSCNNLRFNDPAS